MKKIETLLKLNTLILLFSISAFAQSKKEIHFLADTLNVSPNNQILAIAKEGEALCYTFYCQCVPPYNLGYQPSFCFFKRKDDKSNPILSQKPNFEFISWRELSEIIAKEKYNFDKKYDFYITEVLPNHKYLTNKVRMTIYKEPIVDFEPLKTKH